MPRLTAGERSHGLPATSGGGAPRWRLLASAPRDAHAPRTGAKQRRTHRDQAVQEGTPRCRTTGAWAAAAPQALPTVAPRVQAPGRHTGTVRPTPRSGQRGRPRPAAQPARGVAPSAGARASPLATRQALSAPHRGGILAPNALEEATLSPQEVRTGDPGQAQAARGVRVLQAPQCVATSLSRQKPERLMALVMVLPVGWLVSAA